MPQRKAGITELKKNRTRRLQNLDIKTDLKKTIKKYLVSIESKNTQEAKTNLALVYKKLDKASKRKIFHDNTAARRKARFSKMLANLT